MNTGHLINTTKVYCFVPNVPAQAKIFDRNFKRICNNQLVKF